MQFTITRNQFLVIISLFLCFFVGFFAGHNLLPPKPVTGQGATDITKYCYPVTSGDIHSLPEPFRSLLTNYVNASGPHTIYICGSAQSTVLVPPNFVSLLPGYGTWIFLAVALGSGVVVISYLVQLCLYRTVDARGKWMEIGR